MSHYYLFSVGPCLYLNSFFIQVLSRGSFNLKLDGLFLFMFAMQHMQVFANKLSPLMWLGVYSSIWAMNHFVEPLYFLSMIIASQITLHCYKIYKNQHEKAKNNAALSSFYEKKILENLSKIQVLEHRLETFILEPIDRYKKNVCMLEPIYCEEYDSSLDEMEKVIASQQKYKPQLKRLRKIVMKQTSMFQDMDDM